MRAAAFGYRDLKKLESEVSYYKDGPRVPCHIALKKMVSLSEKMERTVYKLLWMRESLMRSCKEFQIPTDWILDNGIINKVNLIIYQSCCLNCLLQIQRYEFGIIDEISI